MTNKDLVLQGFKAMNSHDLSGFDALLGPNFMNHDMPMPAPGPEGFKQVMAMFLTAFPDMVIYVEEIVGEGDVVASRGYFTGTHRGDFMGIPATGKQVNVKYMDFWRFSGGKAAENWVRMDNVALMQQLGVMPAQ